jgi:GAF domain-containing protein
MDGQNQPEDQQSRDPLQEAQQTIARQSEEIARLTRRLADEKYAEELRGALTLAAAAGTVGSPVSHSRLLEMIVQTAMRVISANAGSLFLIDEEAQELVFEVALGPAAAEVKKFRVPLGHGIAGLVAVTGQPMAVSDAQNDPRQAADIARSVNYLPQSILCVPLYYNDQVTGVLQLLDKLSAPSFSAADMEILGVFANQAAVAIEQSLTHRNVAALIGQVLQSLPAGNGAERERLRAGAKEFAASVEESAAYRQALDLARLVQEIAWQGESELKACRAILQGFAEYLRQRPTPAGGFGDIF